jgi:hypothetical protein
VTGAPPTASIPDALQALLNTTSDAVDDALATVVWHVQVQKSVRDTNGWVPVMTVDETLRAWFADTAVEVKPPDPAELTEIRRRSRLLELDVDVESGETLVRLTNAGEEVAEPNTGDVQSAGGQAHDEALTAIQTALTRLGFRVSVVTQDGSDQPDAIARHDDLEIPFNVEVETTTHSKPTKILANLQKAQAMDHVPLFVVTGDDEEAGKTTARRIERILDEPVRRQEGDVTEFYNLDAAVSFNGGAPTEGGVTVVRPTTGDSRRTIWTRQDDEYILTDALGTEHARLPDIAAASKDRFPAVYSYDRATGEYTVHEAGETHYYESKDAFRDDWVKVKQPFVPEHELPVSDYARNSYAIVILGTDDDTGNAAADIVHLYDHGETIALSTIDDIPSSLATGADHAEAPDVPAPDPSDLESVVEATHVDGTVYDDEDTFLESFVETRVIPVDGNYLPVAEAYAAYASAAAEHEIPVRNTVWFSKMLGDLIEVDRTRTRIDGTLTRCYVGIDLIEPDERL